MLPMPLTSLPDSPKIQIREAHLDDLSLILQFIQKKAEFDTVIGSFSGTLSITEAKLQQTLFGQTSFAKVLLAETFQQAVGFALYYFCYSSFKAQPSLWLDDLYVDRPFRSQGIGKALMVHLAEIANAQSCSHMGWNAWKDNVHAVEFYHRIGGKIIETQEKRLLFHLSGLTDKSFPHCSAEASYIPQPLKPMLL